MSLVTKLLIVLLVIALAYLVFLLVIVMTNEQTCLSAGYDAIKIHPLTREMVCVHEQVVPLSLVGQ